MAPDIEKLAPAAELTEVNDLDMSDLQNEQVKETVEPAELAAKEPEPEAPAKTIREAIERAVKTHSEPAERGKNSAPDPDPTPKTRDEQGKLAAKSEAKLEAIKPVTPAKEPEVDDDLRAPVSWSREAKVEFNKLPAQVRQAVAKREAEMSDGIQKYSTRIKEIEPLEGVISKRINDIRAFGVTPAETVERLFRWMEALTGPNKVQEYQRLGQSFGITVPTQTQQTGETYEQPEIDPNHIPPQLQNALNGIANEVTALKNAQQNQARSAADNFINTWSADKPYYSKVRPIMHALITSGAIPLDMGPDGKPDITHKTLTQAYEQAIYSNADIRAEMSQKQEAERAVKDAKAKADAEKKRQEQIARSKKASVSVRPGAPPPVQSNGRANGRNDGKTPSVRDAIQGALAAARDQ